MAKVVMDPDLEMIRMSMAVMTIEGYLREGSTKEQVLRYFKNPRSGLLHSIYKQYGLARASGLIREAVEQNKACSSSPIHCKTQGWHHLASV